MVKVVGDLLDDSDSDVADVAVPSVDASLVSEVEGVSTCCIVWDIVFVMLLDASDDLYVNWMTSIVDGCTTSPRLCRWSSIFYKECQKSRSGMALRVKKRTDNVSFQPKTRKTERIQITVVLTLRIQENNQHEQNLGKSKITMSNDTDEKN